jgi:membrane protein required for colicin V production
MATGWMWLDWIFLAILALSTILAFFRGFIREAISLVTWIVSFLLALHYANDIGQLMFSSFDNPTVRFGAGFLSIFFAVLIVGMVINFLIGMLIKGTGFGFFDSFLGAVFGFIRGGCLVMIVIMFLAMPWMSAGKLLNKSVIASVTYPVVSWAMTHVPNDKSMSESMQGIMSQAKEDSDTI